MTATTGDCDVLKVQHETGLREGGAALVAGVDEVGRGPLAGPVMAAAVIVPDDERVRRFLCAEAGDSKQLSAARRMALAEFILDKCTVGVGEASVAEIDTVNIRNATFLAMGRALEALGIRNQEPGTRLGVLVDGNARIPDLKCVQRTIVKGDAVELSVACASIVAKVRRDALMCALAREFPAYGWDKNAGYGTALHLHALKEFGACAHHRTSFAPVREVLHAAA